MEVVIKDTYEEVSKAAASLMRHVLNAKPNAVLGLATGSTPPCGPPAAMARA